MLVDSLMDRLADTLASVDPSEQTVISHVLLVELAQHGIDLHQWLLDWYQSAGKHAWQLAYGWQLSELQSRQLTFEQGKKERTKQSWCSGVDSLLIRVAGIVPNEYESCVVVSSARLPCLVAVYREHSQARLITTEDIFRRYLTLAKLFSAIPQKLQLNEPVAMLLIPNEYFFYSGSFFIAYPNFWHEPSYELHLTGRITAVLNGCRISDQKEIYNACKQSHISKQQYLDYTRDRETMPSILPAPEAWLTDREFLLFINHQFFATLGITSNQIEEIYEQCDRLQYCDKASIARVGYRFDHVFFVMEGEIEAETQKTTVVGVEEYVGQCDRWLRTYRSVGRCLVLRIHKDQLRFVLNKRIPKLKLVYHPETVGEHLSLKSD